MEKTTLQFLSLMDMARYAKALSAGYLMNTNKNTLTGKFSEKELDTAVTHFQATIIETSEKVFTY